MSNGETGVIEEALRESLLKKQTFGTCFEKTSEFYVDVSKVQLTFSRIQSRTFEG